MESLQIREKEIFLTLKAIKRFNFVIIGGYAVNAYALPRFSIDCDIVINEHSQLNIIENILKSLGYNKVNAQVSAQFHGEFARFEKIISQNFKVSIDILYKEILDRQTEVKFDADWIFNNSGIIALRGKTITENLKLRIINLDALIVMKFISCRGTDIRDIFMLITKAKDTNWIKQEISKKYDFKNRFSKIREKITSKDFKDNLQGVYGFIDEKIFQKHKDALFRLPT